MSGTWVYTFVQTQWVFLGDLFALLYVGYALIEMTGKKSELEWFICELDPVHLAFEV